MKNTYKYNYHIYSRTFDWLVPRTKSESEMLAIGEQLEAVESRRHLENAPLISFFTVEMVRALDLNGGQTVG
jgi:hypothetical protein